MEISWKQSFLITKPANIYHRHPREKKDSPLWTPSLSFLPRIPLLHTWRAVTAEIVLSPTQTLPQVKGHSVDVTALKAKGAGSWGKMVCTDNGNGWPSTAFKAVGGSLGFGPGTGFFCVPLLSLNHGSSCLRVALCWGLQHLWSISWFWHGVPALLLAWCSATFWRCEWAHTTSLGCWHFHRIVFFRRTAWN